MLFTHALLKGKVSGWAKYQKKDKKLIPTWKFKMIQWYWPDIDFIGHYNFVVFDWSGLTCLVQLLTWLHVSDYRNFWNTDRNILESNNCYSHMNVFQNGVSTLSESTKFWIARTIRFCSNFTNTWTKLSNNVWRDFRLPMSASAMVT